MFSTVEGRGYNAVGMESANEDGSFSQPRQARFRQHLFLVWASRGPGPAHVLALSGQRLLSSGSASSRSIFCIFCGFFFSGLLRFLERGGCN